MPKQKKETVRVETTTTPEILEKLHRLAGQMGGSVKDIQRHLLAAASECDNLPNYFKVLHDLSKKENPQQ